MNDSSSVDKADRLVALLALAATKPQHIENCPSADTLAAMISGSLSGQDRNQMLNHLNGCQNCYYEWLESATVYNTETDLENEEEPDRKDTSKWRLPNLGRHFGNLLTDWKIGVPAIATAALAFLVVDLFKSPPDIHKQINQSFALVSSQLGNTDLEKIRTLSLPSNAGVFGFNAPRISEAKLATAAGFLSGKALLTGTMEDVRPDQTNSSDKDWKTSEWHPYFELGRWLFLAKVLVQSEATQPSDWRDPIKISDHLEQVFKNRTPRDDEAKQVIAALPKLQNLIRTLEQKIDYPTNRALNSTLDRVLNQFVP